MYLLKSIVIWILFIEFLGLIFKSTYSLSKKQRQCADCKYLRYIDTMPGYLCSNKNIVKTFNDFLLEKFLFGKICVAVYYANPNGICKYYEKSWFKWLHKWRTSRGTL